MTDDSPQRDDSELVEVRAAVHLQRLPVGAYAVVDRTDPYVAELIDHGYLVVVTETSEATSDGS